MIQNRVVLFLLKLIKDYLELHQFFILLEFRYHLFILPPPLILYLGKTLFHCLLEMALLRSVVLMHGIVFHHLHSLVLYVFDLGCPNTVE
jgi:hypothetical protein